MAAPRRAAAAMLWALLRGARPGPGPGPGLGWAAALGWGQPGSPLVQAARAYARPVRRRSQELPSHLDDIPPTMLRKEYAGLPIIDKADDVVKKILSLEMAGQREKVKIKMEQLAEKVRRAPNDNGSCEVQVAYLTAKIRSYQEHLQKHPKVFEEVQKLKAPERLKQRRKWQEKARAAREQAQQRDGTPV